MIEELLQRAGKADLPFDRLHFALQPRHLGEADAMDRVGGEIGGRAFRHAVRVERCAAGHAAQADAVAVCSRCRRRGSRPGHGKND